MGSVDMGFVWGNNRGVKEAQDEATIAQARAAKAQADWQAANPNGGSSSGSGGGNLYQDAEKAQSMRMNEWETRRQAMEAANQREKASQREAAQTAWQNQDKNKMNKTPATTSPTKT